MYEEVCLQLKVWHGSLRPRNLKIVDSTARTICTHLQPPPQFLLNHIESKASVFLHCSF